MSKSKVKSQLNNAIQVLLDLSINVTTEDRKAAIKEFGCHDITIARYLKGRGTDLDTATDFIRFFKGRIAEREKAIAA